MVVRFYVDIIQAEGHYKIVVTTYLLRMYQHFTMSLYRCTFSKIDPLLLGCCITNTNTHPSA